MSINKCSDDECLCNDGDILHGELLTFVRNHRNEILGLLKIDEQKNNSQQQIDILGAKLEEIKVQLESKTIETLKLQTCLETKEKESAGSHSMYKGEYRELQQEIMIGNLFSENYTIDGKKCMHKMDIRMIHKEHEYTIGIETKEKKKLTLIDINKFHTDRLNNNFWGGIFISTECPINGYVQKKDTYKLTNNELYIYSNDANLIGITVGCFLYMMEDKFRKHKALEETNTTDAYVKLKEHNNKIIDHGISLYKKWSTMKKTHVDFDKQMILSLVEMGVPEKLFNGHIYMVPKSKCKVGKGYTNPYGI